MSGLAGDIGVLESALRRDRLIILAGLTLLAGLAWAYVVHMAQMADAMSAMTTPAGRPWDGAELGWLVVMWTVMMIAMMVPSAAPAILLFARVARHRRAQRRPAAPVAVFTLGYLLVWSAFAVLAALSQWVLHALALLTPAMASASPVLGGLLLVGAGVYQWLPVKGACLTHCQSPLGFFAAAWREGRGGALVMGLRHGAYCVGCCWALMALLFVAGVMNLLWVAVLAVFVLIEKAAPGGRPVGRLTGLVLVVWGGWLLLSGVLGAR